MTVTALIGENVTLLRRPRTLLACALLLGLSHAASAEDVVAATPAPASPEAAVISSDAPGYRLTFKALGKDYTMSLRGIESSDTVNFDMRADEVVTGAQLTLQ